MNILLIKILIIIFVVSKGILIFNPESVTGFSIILILFTISKFSSTILYSYLDHEIFNISSKITMLLKTRNERLIYDIGICTQIMTVEKLIINIFTISLTVLIDIINMNLISDYDIKFEKTLLKLHIAEGMQLQPILKQLVSSIQYTIRT